ncbi:DUF2254 domain-containing protein [Streptomyces sp. NPDC050095]|uniref:DUF2254 domain-containing protein n=1 Tax=unclassified Streptomyces TaxID=2593676 RepID=UPI0034192E39
MPTPSSRWRRTRRRLHARPVWRLPLTLLAAGVLLAWLLPYLDRVLAHWEHDYDEALFPEVDGGAMSNLLSAVAGGMITLTGLVFTAITLAMQFGSAQLSLRVVPMLREDPIMRWSIGTFLATFVYTLLISVRLAVREEDYRPVLSMLFAIGLSVVCALLVLALVTRVTGVLNSGYLLRYLAAEGHEAVRRAHPRVTADDPEAAPPHQDAAEHAAEPAVIRLGTVPRQGQVLLSFDARRLEEYARETGVGLELVPAVGDFIARQAPLFFVYGPVEHIEQIDRETLIGCLLFGDTHGATTDPGGALRALVDVALKALSPAVNDPGRAVQALDHIEDLLMVLAPVLHEPASTTGRGAFRYRTRSWADYVCIATDEIRHFSGTALQVQRRLRALYATVALACAPEQRAPLRARVAALDAVADAQWPEELDHRLARRPDPQGLGSENGSVTLVRDA